MEQTKKKLITILIPTFNEEANVTAIAEAVSEELQKFADYDYEVLFIDNDSEDSTRRKIRDMAAVDPHIKAIFNAKNYGQFNSPFYGILQAKGDCVIVMVADFQEPPSLIPKYIKAWEEGHKIVLCQKTKTKEKGFFAWGRRKYYGFMKKHANVDMIEQVTGSGLYDREFIEVMRSIDDSRPFLRGVVTEMGYNIKLIEFEQSERRAGRSSNNMKSYYDATMQSLTAYTKICRAATPVGLASALISAAALTVTAVYKVLNWNTFDIVPYLFGFAILILLSVNIFFVGLVGEYVMDANMRLKKRPLVIESERINY